MTKLRVSAQARRDLQDIRRSGYREHGAKASDAHVERFRRLFALLREQPYAGQERPEFGLDIRSLSNRPHRILYRVEGDCILIDRVLHQARDVGRALRGEQ